jgi:1-acyl-sn-glycerol-3-phosphate acyltransferase
MTLTPGFSGSNNFSPQLNAVPKSGWSLDQRDPDFIRLMMPFWEWQYKHYFRVQTSGWEHITAHKQALFVGSHNGGLASPDTSMMMHDWFQRFGFDRQIYGLMHPAAWKINPPLAALAAKAGAIIAHPKMAIAALRQGADVLVYPGGVDDVFRPYSMRDRIHLAGRKGFIKIALRERIPIIPVISCGSHDTLIVLTDIYDALRQIHDWGIPWPFGIDPIVFPVYLGLPWGLALGPLPNIPFPVTIQTRICPPIVFEHYGSDAANDVDYINDCYKIVEGQMQAELDGLIQKRDRVW